MNGRQNRADLHAQLASQITHHTSKDCDICIDVYRCVVVFVISIVVGKYLKNQHSSIKARMQSESIVRDCKWKMPSIT